MINPYYFTDGILKTAVNNNLDGHHINRRYSKLTNKPKYLEVENLYVNKIVKEMAKIYARLIDHYKFKYQTVFSARFDNQDEDDQILDEVDLFLSLNINRNLTESEIDKIDVRSQLEQQIQTGDEGLMLEI